MREGTASRPVLWPIQPPIQWVPGALSLAVQQPGYEADHSPPSSAEVKNAWSYISIPRSSSMAWCLIKHRDNLTFTLPMNETAYFTLPGKYAITDTEKLYLTPFIYYKHTLVSLLVLPIFSVLAELQKEAQEWTL
jgi:hypothetical protein